MPPSTSSSQVLLRCQVEAELLPEGEDNPWGNAFVKKETDLVDESTSGRVVDCLKSRFWKIKNPAVCHEYSGRSRPHPCHMSTHLTVSPQVICCSFVRNVNRSCWNCICH